jgi:hypothetical protein
MNERERWIVYPLLFFALGASLRDKFLQHVSSKEIECQRLVAKQIECEGAILVLDPKNPRRPLVELGGAQPLADADVRGSDRFGVLVLRDSSGQEFCGVTNNELFVRRIQCEGVAVIDPNQPTQAPLGELTSGEITPDNPDQAPRKVGLLVLNGQPIWQLFGLPLPGTAPPEAGRPRPRNETPAEPEDSPPGEEEPAADADESAG